MPTFTFSPLSVSGIQGYSMTLSVSGLQLDTYVKGVNAEGYAFGTYVHSNPTSGLVYSGFVYKDGVITPFEIPGASSISVTGADAAGDAFGSYTDGTNVYGFVYKGGAVTPISVAGASWTNVTGANGAGDAFGNYADSTGTHGFVYKGGVITPMNIPGATSITVAGAGAAGHAFGTYYDGAGLHAFVYKDGAITPFDIPGATGITVTGASAAGDAFGYYYDNAGCHSFAGKGGAITPFAIPGATATMVTGASAAGDAFGYYYDSTGYHGFVEKGGVITPINIAGAASIEVVGVDAAGDALGCYYDGDGRQHSYVYKDGALTAFTAPGAANASSLGIGADGELFGTYTDSAGTHSIVEKEGAFTAIDAAGASSTTVTGISAAGYAFGTYIDSTGTHGFVEKSGVITPVNIPEATWITVTGVNADGYAIGTYQDVAGYYHGFVDENGVIAPINISGATSTEVAGVDGAGNTYGTYKDSATKKWRVFVANKEGAITTFGIPAARYMAVTGVDAAGDAFGYYEAGTLGIRSAQGFAVDKAGAITTFSVDGHATVVSGAGSAGDAFGYYMTGYRYSPISHGFVYKDGAFTLIDVAGAKHTYVTGAGVSGDVVGRYVDAAGQQYAFLSKAVRWTASTGPGDFNVGQTITLSATFDGKVTVKGRPVLTLNDGGTAVYKGGSGTNTLKFVHTIGIAQNASALAITGSNLNGSTISITDADGMPAYLLGATVAGLKIGATVQSITANVPSTAILGPGAAVTFKVTMSEPVNVAGAPYLTLNDGGRAAYKCGSGTNTLTFAYKVGSLGSGQNTPSLAVTGFAANGGAVYYGRNKANTSDLSGVSQFASGPQVDTTAPTVSSVTTDPAGGDLNAGKTVTLAAAFSEAVTVTGGVPVLRLNDGGKATYTGGSGTNTLSFRYTVARGQNTTDLAVTGYSLAGAAIKDAAGNKASLANLIANPAGVLQIDTIAPTVTKVAATAAAGGAIGIALTMSEAVAVSGAPQLLLNNGGIAAYDAARSTQTSLAFDYTAPAGQNINGLKAVGVLLPDGSPIADLAGNAANMSGAKANLGLPATPGIRAIAADQTIAGSSLLELLGASSQNVAFAAGASGTLQLDTAERFSGRVSGFGPSDILDLANLAFGPSTKAAYTGNGSGGILTVSNGCQAAHIHLQGNYLASAFTLGGDSYGGTAVFVSPQTAA